MTGWAAGDPGANRPPSRPRRSRVERRERHDRRRRGSGPLSTRIVIVDDHAVVRSGLRLLLDAEADLEVVAEAADARGAVFELRAHKPDVVLLDVVMLVAAESRRFRIY